MDSLKKLTPEEIHKLAIAPLPGITRLNVSTRGAGTGPGKSYKSALEDDVREICSYTSQIKVNS